MEAQTDQIEIDGEGWELECHPDVSRDFWIAHGTNPRNRGCIVSAYSKEALLKAIPVAREKQRMASIAIGMENAIVRAFKDVITSNMLDGFKGADDYAERQEKFAQLKQTCLQLWPWIFEEAPSRDAGKGGG